MKATIDIDPTLYRRLKIEAARSGRTIRELVAEGLRHVLGMPPVVRDPGAQSEAWFGSLRSFAPYAGGAHDLAAMRRSVAEGRGGARGGDS
jgi:hypothetical protein